MELLSNDPAYLDHVRRSGAWMADFCTCRTNEDGTRWYKCIRKACNNVARACGGNCRSCFKRKMDVAGKRPEVIALCGSTKFKNEFEETSRRFGLEGKIVLTVACFGHAGDLPPEACIDGHPTKTALDELHKRKIDMANRVFIINVGGYIGTSTRSEIEYAEWFEKNIEYLEPLA